MKIVTGLQPTGIGEFHIGNYCGAIYPIKKAIENKEVNREDVYIFIANLHSMTVKTTNLREKTCNMVKSLQAFNITENIYIQSEFPKITEGLWLLSQFTKVGEMNRMTQFKEKEHLGSSSIGLYTYPILMAADILFMNGTHIPVGDDQKQHLEVVRDIAIRVNSFSKEDIFVIPEIYQVKNNIRIKCLKDYSKKMSKTNSEGCIFFSDSREIIEKKIKKAVTDSLQFPSTLEELFHRQGGGENLINIFSIVEDISVDQVIEKFQGVQWSVFKEALINSIDNFNQQFYKTKEKKILSIETKNYINKQIEKKLNQMYHLFF